MGRHILSDIREISAATAEITHSLSAAVAADCNFTGNTQQVTVTGCGTKGANGTYKRDPNFIGSAHYNCNSFTRKKKQSSRNTYALYRKDMHWYLTIWTNNSITQILYCTRSNTDLPPENGWMPIDGSSPAPKMSM